MLVLGLETSCDETGVALYDSERGLLADALFSQIDLHRVYGGVVPELASRRHITAIEPTVRAALNDANLTLDDIDALITPAPFRERLVWFWTNHFTISVRRGACLSVAAPFVEEAIRPHVTASFHDMLLAVMRHPAMLIYLDNVNSIGPESTVGKRIKRGLNDLRQRHRGKTRRPQPQHARGQRKELAVIIGVTLMRQGQQTAPRRRPDRGQHAGHGHPLCRHFAG